MAFRIHTFAALAVMTATVPQFVAAGTYSLPAGCEAYVTVQSRQCNVTHHFTCANDPDGHQRRVDLDNQAMLYLSMIDYETQWVQSYSPQFDEYERLLPDANDPASFTELLETGFDSYDFRLENSNQGILRFVGSDRLTGRTVTIDGVDLLETDYEAQFITEAGEVSSFSGTEYIHPEWRIFISGTRTWVTDDTENTYDGSPVEFHFPGDPGFLSDTAKFDCGGVVSKTQR